MSKNLESLNRANQSIGNFFHLIYVQLRTAFNNCIENSIVCCLYYRKWLFLKIDLHLFWHYLFKNPFRISKKFLIEKEAEDVYAYGETYLTALHAISKHCGITSNDHVYELGCGRGRSLFWLHSFVNCNVTGIEFISVFVHKAQVITNKLQLKRIRFIAEDILKVNLTEATVIYFYGTSFDDLFIYNFIEKCKSLKKGTKIITVSFPLAEYSREFLFETIKEFEVKFPWGRATIYLQIKK